ncbi:uracil-DNA glycosylase [Burkholderia vietnamiensis]|uniref:uracil-DNA glycosylase n=1 Tax=Burkholderia vietnamiensis TaxID=60552 RepID=UPI001CB3E27E|nr:uracil-DNA glycosylase [Burkholderia vietnamiensis]CAG9211713.1 Uracil-DNA glycosylase, family 4 [Burkholderia vietnamiensis]HDR8963868.1 uracil-DNA glycosylase [Burkholderia vietnamiensis]
MAWAEAALEEMGLAQIWVRRGQKGQGSAAGDAAAATTATAVPADVADAAASPAQRTTRSAQPAQPVQAREDATSVGKAMPRAESDRPAHAAADHASMPATSPAPASDMPLAAEDDFAWFDATPPGDPLPPAEMRADVAPVATLDWDALAARVAGCTSCRLCEKRTQTVFGVGDREADWMLIGEAPGENEDKQGEPFVGQAGKLLDNMLQSLTLARGTNVYIANVIKCRPPGNRNPEPDEVARCEPYLQRQVALVKPKLIVALGRFAAQTLLKTDASIASLRGRVHTYEGVPVIVTYHPAYLLRSLQDKSKAWADLCLARDTFRQSAATDASGPAGR